LKYGVLIFKIPHFPHLLFLFVSIGRLSIVFQSAKCYEEIAVSLVRFTYTFSDYTIASSCKRAEFLRYDLTLTF
jgi:hypothetical protein